MNNDIKRGRLKDKNHLSDGLFMSGHNLLNHALLFQFA